VARGGILLGVLFPGPVGGAPGLSGQDVQVEGPPPQDPGLLLPLLPAVLFLLLAFVTWWIWRKLAE